MPSSPPLKRVIAFTDRFARLPLSVNLICVLLAGLLVARLWRDARVGGAVGLLALGDGAMLVLLPRFQRSFGPPQLPWLSLTLIRLTSALFSLWLPRAPALVAVGLIQLVLSVTAAYATWVEPFRLGVTRVTLHSPQLNGCPPLRLLHISDLHVERLTAREQRLLARVKELEPHLIVVTGDYLNLSYLHDRIAHQQTRELLAQLHAPAGVYAIAGSPSVDRPEVVFPLLNGSPVAWLRDEVTTLHWHGCRLQIAGLECSDDVSADERKLRGLLDGRAADAFTVLLYHTPDVMPAAAALGVDLYLAGHTHGGQLRLPLFGAIVTASRHGKRYEMGAYRQGNTMLYVSRGLGMEGSGAPRARFLCPPEIILFTLLGNET